MLKPVLHSNSSDWQESHIYMIRIFFSNFSFQAGESNDVIRVVSSFYISLCIRQEWWLCKPWPCVRPLSSLLIHSTCVCVCVCVHTCVCVALSAWNTPNLSNGCCYFLWKWTSKLKGLMGRSYFQRQRLRRPTWGEGTWSHQLWDRQSAAEMCSHKA